MAATLGLRGGVSTHPKGTTAGAGPSSPQSARMSIGWSGTGEAPFLRGLLPPCTCVLCVESPQARPCPDWATTAPVSLAAMFPFAGSGFQASALESIDGGHVAWRL